MHSRHTQQCRGSSTSTTPEFKILFICSKRRNNFFNCNSCFATALMTQTITAPIVPVVTMNQRYQYSYPFYSFSFFDKSVCTPIWDFCNKKILETLLWVFVPAICVWLTPCVCYSLCLMAIFPGTIARGTGRLRTNKAGAKMLPAFPIPILNPLSFLLIA